MAQYDDPRNPFSAGRPEAGSPWGETAAAPSPGQGGLQLPGEINSSWGSEGPPRPSPVARRRNQWRQHQQLTPDFGPGVGAVPTESPPDPEPALRPAARNASLPAFRRGPQTVPQAPSPQPSPAPTRLERPAPGRQSAPPRPPHPGAAPLQMHPHSIHPGTLNHSGANAPGMGTPPGRALPTNVTPLRPQPRRPEGASAAAQAARRSPHAPLGLAPGTLSEAASSGPGDGPLSPRRSRTATARRRLANPPLPLLYLIRLIILGVGVAAIAGTLLSVLSPTNVAAPGQPTTPSAQANAGRAAGSLVQGTTAATVTDLRLTGEISHLKGELEQLATLTPGLTPVSFAIDLDSGQYVDLGGAEPVSAASTIKVPILVAFLQQVDAGTLALNQSIALQEEYMASGSGTLRGEAVGTEYTALDLATRMIVTSDNTATNMMIAALGGIEALNQTFATWGLEHTLLRNPLPDLDGTNTTSAKDLTLIMALIDQGGLLTPRSRDRLFSIMQRTENGSLIPSGIRDGSLLANKTGDIGSMLGDVALVDVPNGKRYALAVLVQRPTNDGRASELIRRMTETVHTEMAQPVAPVGGGASTRPLSPPGEFETAPPPGEFETQPLQEYEDPYSPAPADRAPARDEIPPG